MASIPEALEAAERALAAGDVARAELVFRQVLAAVPDEPGALNGLGVVAFRAGRPEEAESYHRRAIERFAGNPAFYNNLNLVYCRQGRPAEAVECCRRAIELAPQVPQLHVSLGNALKQCGKLAASRDSFRRAIELAPDYGDAHFNLANTLTLLGQLDEAAAEYDRALALSPNDADAHYNRALLWLLRGDFARGWPELEWRWKMREFTQPKFAQPRWQGEPLAGRTILVWGEQGLGDAIQMIRFAPALKAQGATVLVACRPALWPLLETAAGIDRFVDPDRAAGESFDFYIPLMSLPGVLGTALDTIPSQVPYLGADPARIERWRRERDSEKRFRVGIAWQGRPTYVLDLFRSVPLVEFAPLADCPGVAFFSLQKGHGVEQLATLGERLSIVDFGGLLDADGAFVDTAAVMRNLDLVITSDTAIAHLAGALAVPVWVALALVPDWRWLLDRDDSPWYPTMRLFRQTAPGDWPSVFRRIADELDKLVESKGDA
jgi:Flp pilus assembly protein TadD